MKSALIRASCAVEPRLSIGTNIYDREWDVLVILDACRYDLFREFAPKHPAWSYFESVDSIYSVAASTPKWLSRTFQNAPGQEVADTHYVACTPFAEKKLTAEEFHQIDHVWRYAKDHDSQQTKPEAVTDAGIDAIRNSLASKVIIHYVQPHAPFLHCLGKYDSVATDSLAGDTQSVWYGLESGDWSRNEVWEDYGKNLLRVLDEVQSVIENAEGKVVITSDHGNGLGELGIYGHPDYAINSAVRKVPWVVATGKGSDEYDIQGREIISKKYENQSIKENLQALGYR